MKISFFGKKILRTPNLRSFLYEFENIVYRQKAEYVGGWGLKPTAQKARARALSWGANYVSLEDGFLRSYGLGVKGAVPLSIIVDYTGIYYDATRPSDLENILNSGFSKSEMERAEKLVDKIRTHKITKYNTGKEICSLSGNNNVLVIDQTRNDASVQYGMADENSFKRMLKAALSENPDSNIIIKTHPDVIAGKKQGYLCFKNNDDRIKIIGDDINTYTLFENASAVYTVSSLAGMEALIAGKKVRCFGMPFYAGWGLTQDELKTERRNRNLNLPELVAGAYLKYPRYVNPYTGNRCEAEEAVEILSFVREYYLKHQNNYVCAGVNFWKTSFIKPYINSVNNQVRFVPRFLKPKILPGEKLLVWASRQKKLKIEEADGFIEDGFIRSVGLGSNFIPASSLAIDNVGIYYDYSKECDLEKIIKNTDFDAALLERARNLRTKIISNHVTKYNTEPKVGSKIVDKIAKDKKIILVVGQVEGDASIVKGSPEIKTNLQLLQKVRVLNQDAFIIYKPHPEVVAGNRKGKTLQKIADLEVTNINIYKLVELADEIHTITSLVGFEALLMGKAVHVYGLPFYSGWGLTQDHINNPRRNRKSTVDELVAASLILYPSYFCFECNLPATAEVIVERFISSRLVGKNKISFLEKLINIYKLFLSK